MMVRCCLCSGEKFKCKSIKKAAFHLHPARQENLQATKSTAAKMFLPTPSFGFSVQKGLISKMLPAAQLPPLLASTFVAGLKKQNLSGDENHALPHPAPRGRGHFAPNPFFRGIEVQGDGGLLFFLALAVFSGSAVLAWLHRREIPVMKRWFA